MNLLRVITLLLLTSMNLFGQPDIPLAERGVLDARKVDFSQMKISLNGYWNFYANELVNPSDIIKKSGDISAFPKVWNQDTQYGTYQLLVLMPSDTGKFAIEIPQLYCSYELWVNGISIAQNGKVGTTRESTTPQWLPQTVSFESSNDTLTIVLQIANFYHHKGGAKEPIHLGKVEVMNQHRAVSVRSNATEFFVLILMGLVFFIIFYIREERKKITLYFALLCLSWAIRSVFSNLYLSASNFPSFNWDLLVKIEYITLYLTMMWAILFLSRLFPNEGNNIIKYILVGTNCFFAAATAITPPLFFTEWLYVYLGVAAVLLLFGGVIVIKALINDRTGVWYLVACVFLNILLFAYDIFVYEGLFSYYNNVLFSIGYISMFFMLGIALMYHLKIFKGESSSTLTYEDLYGKSK